MTSGLIFAAICYLASVILTALIGFAVTGGDARQTMDAVYWAAWGYGPAVFAPLGFVLGFFREKRANRRKRSKADFDAQEAMLGKRERLHQTTTVRPVSPPRERQMSAETREYLEKTKHVDTKGITEFLKETRSHQIDKLKKQMENGSAGA